MSATGGSGRHDSAYPDVPIHHREPSPMAGTKRLYSNRELRILGRDDSENIGENNGEEFLHAETEEAEFPSWKRHRASDWPLRNASMVNVSSSRPPLRSRNAANSPSHRRPSSAQARVSKFIEASMNDRVSQEPPSSYIVGDEDLRERYEFDQYDNVHGRKLAQPRKPARRPTTSESSAADRSEASRRSGIFRFGKSIASTFNPSNWKIWSKQQQQSDEETAQERILKDRQEMAERTYNKLKLSGQLLDGAIGQRNYQESEDKIVVPAKHDSGIDFSNLQAINSRLSGEMSWEAKRMGRVFASDTVDPNSGRAESSASNVSASVAPSDVSSVRKRGMLSKKSSMSNVRKTRSKESSPIALNYGNRQLRKVPSRKELQKQQRLVKRVSDLEDKLLEARRQLADVVGEPFPLEPPKIVRQRFVPGNLPSLPSERLLRGFVNFDDGASGEDENYDNIGKALTTDTTESRNLDVGSGAKIDGCQPELVSHSQEASHLGIDKPSQNVQVPSFDQSPESDIVDGTAVYKAVLAHQVKVVENRGIISSHASAQQPETPESGKEGLDNSQSSVEPQSASQQGKKRKSSCKPTEETESEAESDIRTSTTPPKKESLGRPRKVQKAVQEPDVEVPLDDNSPIITPDLQKRFSPKIPRKAVPRSRGSPTKKSSAPGTASTQVAGQSQSKISGSGRLLVSPPPATTASAGLEYIKPSTRSGKNLGPHHQAQEGAYTAIPTAQGEDVPPMPEMPKSVRLPSGEVIHTTATAATTATTATTAAAGVTATQPVKPSKLTKSRPVSKEDAKREKSKERTRKRTRAREYYDWPDDIF